MMDCLLQIEEERLIFQLLKGQSSIDIVTLNIGYRSVVDRFFKNGIPQEPEIDHAINHIEDALMSDRRLLGEKDKLFVPNKKLKSIFRKNDLLQGSFSRRRVEDLFTSYARVLMGAPTTYLQVDVTKEDVSMLLLIREIMHHLDLQELLFIEP